MRNLLILAIPTLTVLPACGYLGDLNLPLLTEQGEQIERYPAQADTINIQTRRTYPEDAEIAQPLNIEVIREGNAIILDNRTVHTYGPVQLWLNQQYGATLDVIPVGRGEPIALTSFRNRRGEPYPVAQFLAPDASQPLILADLATNNTIHKLTVRLQPGWREP